MNAAVGTGSADTLWSKGNRIPVAGVLALTVFIAFESYAVITALPVVAADLQAERWYSFAFAATVATGLVGMTVGGGWADRSGILTPLAVGGTLFVVGLGLCAAAPHMSVFIAGRLLQGVGGGIDSVVVYVLIAQVVPERLRPRMFGLLVAAWLLPAVVGPLVTGVLVDLLHWRAVFAIVLLGSALALVGLIGVARRAPVNRTDTAVIGRRGVWAVLACLGVVGLHVAGHQPTGRLIAATVIGVAVVAVATVRLMPRGTLTARPGPPRLIALKGLLGATVAATDIYFTLYLQRELGYPPTAAGLVVAIGALGWAAGSWIQGRSDSEAARPGALRMAAALVVAGPTAVLALVAGTVGAPVAVAGCVLMGVGMGMAYPRITSTALAQAEPARHGFISSGLQIAEQLGTSTLTAIIGAVLAVTAIHGYTVGYALIAAVGGLAFAIVLPHRSEESAAAQGEHSSAKPTGNGPQ